MENKVIIIFMVILFDENDNIIDRCENQLKIDSKLQPKSVKQYLNIIESNDKDITDIIKEFCETQNKSNYDKTNYMLINFFTERWDYLIAKEINL